MADFSVASGLIALAVSAFTSATLLPGTSEAALLAVLHRHPQATVAALVVATIANTLGSMTSFAIGRLLPNRVERAGVERLQRYGPASLLFAWVPLAGDALCVAAGWLRFPPWRSMALIAAGKFGRYAALAAGLRWLAG
jgi:membrane protein YqaA with SNARE-associated domain